ncbi:MAG TPA: hypothetical protein VK206_21050, partial [Anaerolineales bacterium]|nr:hypothetical protein [Anaerolineales bacterium]
MKAGISVRNSYASRFGVRLLIACLFLVGLLGCAPVATQPVPRDVPSSVPTETIPTVTIPTATIPTVPTLPAGWQTDTPQQQCGYSISH